MKVEYPAIIFCEVASPVLSLLSQPHRLDMSVAGDAQPWRYFPDLEIVAETGFVDAVVAGIPFATAALSWVPSDQRPEQTKRLVIELKSDDDRRMTDTRYLKKLEMVRETYRRAGRAFVLLTFSRDFGGVDMRPIRDIAYSRFAAVDVLDTYAVVDRLERTAGIATLGELGSVLGSGALARAKLAALHVRRVISIDLSSQVSDASEARLVRPMVAHP